MASEAPEELLENVWLADKEICDVVVCVREKQDLGPPIKKRICDVPTSGSQGECDAARAQVEKKQAYQFQTIMVYTTSEGLAKSSYFKVCLKEPWCKQKQKEGGSIMQLPLETLMASPQGYQRCIEILCSSQPCLPNMFTCPLEALDIYLASDHLLFKECSKACMDYLSAAPWSSEDWNVIHETFSSSSIVPSEEVASRLGLSKEKSVLNLKDTLWSLYEDCYYAEGEPYKSTQLFDLIDSLLQGLTMSNSNSWSKKAISEFLYDATADCVEAMIMSERGEWMLMNKSFLGWLRMTEMILDITDGKEAVKAVASDNDLHKLLLPALKIVSGKDNVLEMGNAAMWGVIRQLVKLLIEMFKRVAEAKVILPATTRFSLVQRWVPWLESVRTNEKVCDANDMHVLKTHIKNIIDTLGMDDDVLSFLAHASMRSEYFLEGAFKSLCARLG